MKNKIYLIYPKKDRQISEFHLIPSVSVYIVKGYNTHETVITVKKNTWLSLVWLCYGIAIRIK